MSELISLIIAALFGVWAYKKGLFATWAFLFNVIIAVYLGLMLTSPVLSWAGQRLNFLGSYANVVVMVVIAAVYFIITNYLSSTFLTTTYYAIFPVIVDKISSPILGFVGGFVLVNFILFAVAISPLKEISLVSKYLPDDIEKSSGRVVNTCGFVSGLSLQYGDKNIAKAVEVVSRSNIQNHTCPAKIAPKVNPPVPSQPAPAVKKKSNRIPELNE